MIDEIKNISKHDKTDYDDLFTISSELRNILEYINGVLGELCKTDPVYYEDKLGTIINKITNLFNAVYHLDSNYLMW